MRMRQTLLVPLLVLTSFACTDSGDDGATDANVSASGEPSAGSERPAEGPASGGNDSTGSSSDGSGAEPIGAEPGESASAGEGSPGEDPGAANATDGASEPTEPSTGTDASPPAATDGEPEPSAGTDTTDPMESPSMDGSGGSAGGPDEPQDAAMGGGANSGPSDGPPVVVDDGSLPSSRLTPFPIGESDAPLGYWEYLPPGYGEQPLPLLVFTHGASWQGEGSLETLQKLLEVGPPNLISTDAWPNERPFIVLSPQNPRAGCFDPNDIDAFYRFAVEHYDVDPERIYHTGQSCGAIGAWNYLAGHLDEFVTAAVLISGDGRDAFDQAGCDLGRVAIWGLHNELDASVNSVGTIEPISALMECDPTPDVELTIYPGETVHDAWTKTYDLSAGNDIYSWLLEHVHP